MSLKRARKLAKLVKKATKGPWRCRKQTRNGRYGIFGNMKTRKPFNTPIAIVLRCSNDEKDGKLLAASWEIAHLLGRFVELTDEIIDEFHDRICPPGAPCDREGIGCENCWRNWINQKLKGEKE